MYIALERTRLIFGEYNDAEKKKIENLVGTMDRVFTYEDIDNHRIYLPTGMVDPIKKSFPGVRIEDRSSEYWDYAHIKPINHSAEPRNQLQIDFIKFAIEKAKEKRKVAGVLSPGRIVPILSYMLETP
jgi:hypothetical protein